MVEAAPYVMETVAITDDALSRLEPAIRQVDPILPVVLRLGIFDSLERIGPVVASPATFADMAFDAALEKFGALDVSHLRHRAVSGPLKRVLSEAYGAHLLERAVS